MTALDDVQSIADSMMILPTGESVHVYYNRARNAARALNIDVGPGAGSVAEGILSLRYHREIVQRIRDCSDMYFRATAAGLFFSEDPIQTISSLNRDRTVLQPIQQGDYAGVMDALSALCQMVDAEAAGTLSLSGGRPQIGGASISFEGLQGIPSSIFSADSLKKQQALDSLKALDFTKRRPKLLFVAERNAETFDIVVGWRKMRDATSYDIELDDIVAGVSRIASVQSLKLEAPDQPAVSFYREKMAHIIGSLVPEKDIALYRFASVSRDTVYSVSITPKQVTTTSKSLLFKMPMRKLILTDEQLGIIESEIREFVRFSGAGIDSITPYPFISDVVYGSRRFGWVLAGINLLSSFERNEQSTIVRSYSYIGAKFSEIRNRITSGNFYIPSDISAAERNLNNSFLEHGLSSTLTEILEKCGMLLFFDDREGFDTPALSIGITDALRETGVLAAILGTIDPVTATVSPTDIYSRLRSRIEEARFTRSSVSLQSLLTVPRLDTTDESIDILSYDGITRLMNVIVDSSQGAS